MIAYTASTLYDLIEQHCDERKLVIATHHVGMFSTLSGWLMRGEKGKRHRPRTRASILSAKHGEISLETHRSDVFLYHLRLLQMLEQARQEKKGRAHHFAQLRQLLETVSSFLGVSRIS